MAKKKSLRDRLADQKKKLSSGKSGGFIMRQKDEGTIRFRILPTGEENDFAMELTTFWLSQDAGEIISPSTFGEPCPAMEKYLELKESKDPDDIELTKKLVPRKKYVIPVIMYKDSKGTEVDEEQSNRLLQISSGIYQEIIDFYLDEDEWGDMTNPKTGYDLKQTRTGKGKNDTKYTINTCKNTPLPKAYSKTVIDLEEMAKKYADTYESALAKLENFLGTTGDDEDEDEVPRRKKSRESKTNKPKKRRKSSDI